MALAWKMQYNLQCLCVTWSHSKHWAVIPFIIVEKNEQYRIVVLYSPNVAGLSGKYDGEACWTFVDIKLALDSQSKETFCDARRFHKNCLKSSLCWQNLTNPQNISSNFWSTLIVSKAQLKVSLLVQKHSCSLVYYIAQVSLPSF